MAITRDRFFLKFRLFYSDSGQSDEAANEGEEIEPYIRETIHIPGLRGNPERTYVLAAVGKTFPGTFENYVASVIAKWQAENNDNLEGLCRDLRELGLTSKVLATPLNDTQVELQVARLPPGLPSRGND